MQKAKFSFNTTRDNLLPAHKVLYVGWNLMFYELAVLYSFGSRDISGQLKLIGTAFPTVSFCHNIKVPTETDNCHQH
jgi:hypothetical protein